MALRLILSRRELASSVRELGELMERFAGPDDEPDPESDAELIRLCDRVERRVLEIRESLTFVPFSTSGRPDNGAAA